MNYYYMDDNNKEIGPVSMEYLKSFRLAGVIKDHTLVRPEDGGPWVKCESIIGTIEADSLKSHLRHDAMLMKKYLFMVPVLKSLDDGTPFRRGFALALRIIAALLTIGLLIAWIALWKVVFSQNGVAIFGGFIFQIVFIVGSYMVIHTYWIRANEIERLGKSDYKIIPIVSILIKMNGEISAWFLFTTGIGAGIFQILAGYQFPGIQGAWPANYGPFQNGMTSSFISGLLVIVFGAIFALFWLILSYFLSELIIVVVDIAKNTRLIRESVERQQR
jgi:hypothetical protein